MAMDYMQRALALARQALGRVSPNPAVGAVLVRSEQVVGEGYTQPPGGPHAEIVGAPPCTSAWSPAATAAAPRPAPRPSSPPA